MHRVLDTRRVKTVVTVDGWVFYLRPGSFEPGSGGVTDVVLTPGSVVTFDAQVARRGSTYDRVSLIVDDIRSIQESVS